MPTHTTTIHTHHGESGQQGGRLAGRLQLGPAQLQLAPRQIGGRVQILAGLRHRARCVEGGRCAGAAGGVGGAGATLRLTKARETVSGTAVVVDERAHATVATLVVGGGRGAGERSARKRRPHGRRRWGRRGMPCKRCERDELRNGRPLIGHCGESGQRQQQCADVGR